MITSTIFFLAIMGQTPPANFDIRSADGKARAGAIESLSSDLSMTLGNGIKLDGGQIYSLRRDARAAPSWPSEPHIELHNGDRLVGFASGMSDSFLSFWLKQVKHVEGAKRDGIIRIPLLSISRIWLQSPDRLDRDKYPSIIADSRNVDLVVLKNGDVVSGSISAVDAQKDLLEVDQGAQKRSLALSKAIVVAFSTKLARNRLPTEPYAKVVLTNGTRLTLTDISIHDGLLYGKTMYRERIEVSLADLIALDIHQGLAVYLSDLKPSLYQYRTFEGEQFNWRADRDLRGRELQLQSANGLSTFDKGISVHGECTFEYALDRQYQRFESVVGLDPHVGQRGSVEIRVLVDGKEMPFGNGKPLTLQNGPWQLNLDLHGGKMLTLKVLWGEGGNVGDYVNWGDARLIRNPK